MKTMLIGLSFLGLTSLSNAQNPAVNVGHVQLDKVVVSSVKNARYYNSVYSPHASVFVNQLESEAGKYDIKKSALFAGNTYNEYTVMFKNSHGKIIAMFDENGELYKSVERFEDVLLPERVRTTLLENYPDWMLRETVYRVNYFKGKDVKKIYKVEIYKGDDKIDLKINSEGVILRTSD